MMMMMMSMMMMMMMSVLQRNAKFIVDIVVPWKVLSNRPSNIYFLTASICSLIFHLAEPVLKFVCLVDERPQDVIEVLTRLWLDLVQRGY